ncbi:MAG: TlyA family RNA methyltransferase [Campylobacteraceae bacterium]|nr:TlyA family RNA methyltransferase [Campylobacteraceae bacterium]
MRLDLYLTKYFNIQSRNKASELIKAKKVKVDEKIVSKPSFIVSQDHKIEVLEDEFYVSRAAYKLKYFVEEFQIQIKDKEALDIGSSTGGFTQILLEKGAKSVVCVDVGSNQLHERIKDDKRIIFYENQDIRTFKSENKFEIVTCDVSFISILNIIEDIDSQAKNEIIILFKPQFEVGTNVKRDKKGVVKDSKAITKSRDKFLDACKLLGWNLKACAKSKLEGKDGNEEELFYFEK